MQLLLYKFQGCYNFYTKQTFPNKDAFFIQYTLILAYLLYTDATNMLDESDKTAQNGRRERFWQKKITALQNLHPSPQNRALYNFSSAVHTILHHMIKQVALIAGSL